MNPCRECPNRALRNDFAETPKSEQKPIPTTKLAQMIGCSSKFIRDEIASGHLKAIRVGHGNGAGTRLRVPYAEAKRYCQKLGVDFIYHRDGLPHAVDLIWSLAQSADTAACLVRNNVVLAVNTALCAMSGYTAQETVGQPPGLFKAKGSSLPKFPERVMHAERISMTHRDGYNVVCLVTRIPIQIEQAQYVVVMIASLLYSVSDEA